METEKLINKHYRAIFDGLMDTVGDDMFDIIVEVKLLDGTTVRRSWQEREERLREDE